MEISGCLTGRAAQEAYEGWRSATRVAPRLRCVVDISYVTSADETGRAVLRAWRAEGVGIVASSCISRAIADSTPGAQAVRHFATSHTSRPPRLPGCSVICRKSGIRRRRQHRLGSLETEKGRECFISARPRNGITGALAKGEYALRG